MEGERGNRPCKAIQLAWEHQEVAPSSVASSHPAVLQPAGGNVHLSTMQLTVLPLWLCLPTLWSQICRLFSCHNLLCIHSAIQVSCFHSAMLLNSWFELLIVDGANAYLMSIICRYYVGVNTLSHIRLVLHSLPQLLQQCSGFVCHLQFTARW